MVDPKTLNPPTDNIKNEYDKIYFPTYTNWSAIDWKTPNSEITSEQEGVTYGFLDYTQENIVSAEVVSESRAEYCTGIVFKAKYIPDGKSIIDSYNIYLYNGQCYTELPQGVEEDTPGVTKYPDGICYYTYWIKHADDGDNTKVSPMEYAIVRNNIYQLNVTSISGIGTVVPEDNINATIKVYVVNWEEIDTEDVVWGDPVSSN